jgi:hypothetical protein
MFRAAEPADKLTCPMFVAEVPVLAAVLAELVPIALVVPVSSLASPLILA